MTEPTTMQSVKQGVRKFNLAASDTFRVASTRISRSDTKSLDRALVKATTAQRHTVPKPKHVAKLVAAASSNHRDLAYVVSETLSRLHGATDWLTALKSLVLLHQLMEGAPGVLDELVLVSEADRRSAASSIGSHSAAAQGFGSPDSARPHKGPAAQAITKSWDASKKYGKKAIEAVTASTHPSARAASGETGPCRVDNFLDTRTLEGRFDYSEFVRAYGRYLDGQVACYAALRWAPVVSAGDAPFRGLGTADLLRALPALERLQRRLLDVAPRGAAAGDPVTTAALAATVRESFRLYRAVGEAIINLADRFFGMGRVDALRALECYREAAASTDALSAYYASLDASGTLAGVGPMPTLTPPPPEFLQSMETYAETAPEVGEQEPPITAHLPQASPATAAGPDEYAAQLAAQAAQQQQLQGQMAQQSYYVQQQIYQQQADQGAPNAALGAPQAQTPTSPAPRGGSGWGYVPTAAGTAAQGGWFGGNGNATAAAAPAPAPAAFPSTAASAAPAPAGSSSSPSSSAQQQPPSNEASSPAPRRQPVRRGRAFATAAAAGSAAAAAAAAAGQAGATGAPAGAPAAPDAEGEAAAEALAAAAQDPGMLPVAHAKKPSIDLLGLGASNPPSRTGSATPATFAQAHGADWATSRLSQGVGAPAASAAPAPVSVVAPPSTQPQAPAPASATSSAQPEFDWANWGQPQQQASAPAPAPAPAPVPAPAPALQTVASSPAPAQPTASVAHSSASAPSPAPSVHSASSGAPAQAAPAKAAPSPLDLLAGLTVPASYEAPAAAPAQPAAQPAAWSQPSSAWNAPVAPAAATLAAWNAPAAPAAAAPAAWNAPVAPSPAPAAAPSWSAAPPTDAFASLSVSPPAQQTPAQSSWQSSWGAAAPAAAPTAAPAAQQPWIKPASPPAAAAPAPAYASRAPPALNGWSSSGIATVPSPMPSAAVPTPAQAPAPAAAAWGTVAGAPSPSSWGVVGSPTAGQPGSASWGLAPPPAHSQAAPVAPGFFSAPAPAKPDALSKTAGTHDPFAALTGLSP